MYQGLAALLIYTIPAAIDLAERNRCQRPSGLDIILDGGKLYAPGQNHPFPRQLPGYLARSDHLRNARSRERA